MVRRHQFQAILEQITPHVYFQPPASVVMKYPCIIYERDDATTQHADNAPYRHLQRYKVTVIDRDPDSALPGEVARLPTSKFNRFYPADDLNHDVYNVFF